MPNLSAAIHRNTIVANDGDGIVTSVNVNATNPLERAKFTRLADIDALEWEAIHFIKVELPSGDTFQLNRFLRHYSMLGLNFLLHVFNDGRSCGLLHYELPREGFQVPTNPFNREIRQYWIRWLTAPTENQLVLLDKLASLVDGSGLRSRLMSHHDPCQASENEPFLISLNAALVLMGFAFVFTKYCCHKILIALQGVAKQKGLGPIWCDVNFNQMNGICSKSQADYRRMVFEAGTDFEYMHQKGFLPAIQQQVVQGSGFFPGMRERQKTVKKDPDALFYKNHMVTSLLRKCTTGTNG